MLWRNARSSWWRASSPAPTHKTQPAPTPSLQSVPIPPISSATLPPLSVQLSPTRIPPPHSRCLSQPPLPTSQTPKPTPLYTTHHTPNPRSASLLVLLLILRPFPHLPRPLGAHPPRRRLPRPLPPARTPCQRRRAPRPGPSRPHRCTCRCGRGAALGAALPPRGGEGGEGQRDSDCQRQVCFQTLFVPCYLPVSAISCDLPVSAISTSWVSRGGSACPACLLHECGALHQPCTLESSSSALSTNGPS